MDVRRFLKSVNRKPGFGNRLWGRPAACGGAALFDPRDSARSAASAVHSRGNASCDSLPAMERMHRGLSNRHRPLATIALF